MSEISTGGGPGSADAVPSGAAGGLADESDLPSLQGLTDIGADTDQNDADNESHVAADARRDLGGAPGDSQGGSDPMPDMGGTDGA